MAVMHLRVCRWAEGRHLQGTLTLILLCHSVFLDMTCVCGQKRRVRNESGLKIRQTTVALFMQKSSDCLWKRFRIFYFMEGTNGCIKRSTGGWSSS